MSLSLVIRLRVAAGHVVDGRVSGPVLTPALPVRGYCQNIRKGLQWEPWHSRNGAAQVIHTDRTPQGLTLNEAGQRIDDLEAAAAQVALHLANSARYQKQVDARTETMLTCIELLVDQLAMDKGKKSEFVEKSLGMVTVAATELRKSIEQPKAR